MTRARRWACAALAALALAAGAHAEDAARECLPADLKLRVAFSEPKRLAEALRELGGERKRAGKVAALARRFIDAGCTSVDEQSAPGLSQPNLVCKILGRNPAMIAIGASPELDGWAAAGILPEVARAVAAEPREHSYSIAVFSRTVTESPAGARAFIDSPANGHPRYFVHVGSLGSRVPSLPPDLDDEQRCFVDAVARAVVGSSIPQLKAWEQIGIDCRAKNSAGYLGRAGTATGLEGCRRMTVDRLLDSRPFRKRGIPTIGFYAVIPPHSPTRARLDPPTYVLSYRLIAAVSVALDQATPGASNQ